MPKHRLIALYLYYSAKTSIRNRQFPQVRFKLPVFVEISACFARGWSVIPLVGGAEISRGKRPLVRWQTYTRRLPSPSELDAWFGSQAQPAYGVVCGLVSGLVVLDLDDPMLAQRFVEHFPHLVDTFIVCSGQRGTPHLYWRVDYPVRSRTFPGGDLKAEGGYVVGPGSVIGGHSWQIASDLPVRAIQQDELEAVLNFLLPPARPQPEMPSGESVRDYPALYRFYAGRFHSRNQALFVTACHMRDHGAGEAQAVEALARLHAVQPAPDGRVEPFSSRYAEALRTIRSAYSRPARLQRQPDSDGCVSRLPNSVREALLNRPDGVVVARLIEAAHIKGLSAGAVVTEPQLCRLLAGILSRESIRKALAARLDDGLPVFCPPENPPAMAEIPDGMARQKNAFLSAGQKQTRHFVLPDAAELCRRLDVQNRGGDPLTLQDVSSSRQYRQALHKALIRRRPGVYAQAFLGARLGLSSRSIRRYNREAGVRAQPTYHETPLFFTTLDQVPQSADIRRYDIRTGGQFLLDDTGKRWPLKREIAAQLLAQGRHVSVMRQGCSHYSVGDRLAGAQAAGSHTAAPAAVERLFVPAQSVIAVASAGPQITALDTDRFASRPQQPQDSPNLAREGRFTPRSAKSGVGSCKRQFRRPLADFAAERTACHVYRVVDAISLPNARRLVDAYGSQPVEAALRKFRWLKAQGKVTRPAGLLVTLARMSWRASQYQHTPAPRFHAEPARRSRATGYVHPTRDPLWQSAAYRDWRAEFFGMDDPLVNVTLEEMAF
jgi:hypothetical protein